jgi:hypothetical protein
VSRNAIRAQLPGGAHGVGLAVDAGLIGDEAEAVTGGDLRGTAGGVTPADEIAAGVAHEFERLELEPVGERGAEAGPLVGGFLAPAAELEVLAVDKETLRDIPAHGADAEGDFDRIMKVII